jgi:solute carrier family 25 2-oxodicarboxylate transporter 21
MFKKANNNYRQLQTGKGAGEDAYNCMLDCFRKIIKNEGCAQLL